MGVASGLNPGGGPVAYLFFSFFGSQTSFFFLTAASHLEQR